MLLLFSSTQTTTPPTPTTYNDLAELIKGVYTQKSALVLLGSLWLSQAPLRTPYPYGVFHLDDMSDNMEETEDGVVASREVHIQLVHKSLSDLKTIANMWRSNFFNLNDATSFRRLIKDYEFVDGSRGIHSTAPTSKIRKLTNRRQGGEPVWVYDFFFSVRVSE